jgi:hypothetical protein
LAAAAFSIVNIVGFGLSAVDSSMVPKPAASGLDLVQRLRRLSFLLGLPPFAEGELEMRESNDVFLVELSSTPVSLLLWVDDHTRPLTLESSDSVTLGRLETKSLWCGEEPQVEIPSCGETFWLLYRNFCMRPFATGKTFGPFPFRTVEASLLEVAPAGFVFPIFRDLKASVGYQSGAAETCEPVRYQHRRYNVTRRMNSVQKALDTMAILPHPSHQLAPKFRPNF